MAKRRAKKTKKKTFRHYRNRECRFCVDKIEHIDYKDIMLLRRFLSDKGKIKPRRSTGTCAKHQRWLAAAIKRARFVALMPYSREKYR